MRAGKVVDYVAADGSVVEAVVVAVVGSGPSGHKTLDLRIGDQTVEHVVHKADDVGRGSWDHPGSEHAAVGTAAAEAVPSPVVPDSGNAAGRATAGEVDLED